MTKPRRSVYADRLRELTGHAFTEEAVFQHRGRWGEFFRERIGPTFDGRVIFEVGCFDAEYLARIAGKHPRTGFIGLDWKCKAIYEGAQRIGEGGLRNIVLLHGRAGDVSRIFGDGELDEVWVFHPDPCDQPKELQNRLMAEPFLMEVYAVLRDETSRVALKTDHAGYYQWVLALCGLGEAEEFAGAAEVSHRAGGRRVRARDLMRREDLPRRSEAVLDHYRVSANSADFWNDPEALAFTAARCFSGEKTVFEARFVKKRLPIYYVEFRKKSLG